MGIDWYLIAVCAVVVVAGCAALVLVFGLVADEP